MNEKSIRDEEEYLSKISLLAIEHGIIIKKANIREAWKQRKNFLKIIILSKLDKCHQILIVNLFHSRKQINRKRWTRKIIKKIV